MKTVHRRNQQLNTMSTKDLAERVAPHPNLGGAEKETTISMYGDGKEYSIFSAKPTIIKSLLKHDHFEFNWAVVANNGRNEQVIDIDSLRESDGEIVSVEGSMPVGTLTVKSKPRANNHQSSIVTWETIDPSVFGDDEEQST